MTDLRDKNCFITGAASGIGRATAFAAVRAGAKLVLTDIDDAALQDVAKDIRAANGTVLAAEALDVSNYDAVRAFTQQVLAAHGSMDVVMNIAGIAIWGEITALQHEHWRRVVDVNLMGPIHVMECLVPAMVEAGRGGHIVNVSSAAGLFALPLHAAYSASKFGLRGASEVLRFDLKRHGIKVSVVCPGAVDTGLVKTLKIIGVDATDPRVERLRQRFQRHAVTPGKAAQAILDGVRKNRYLIYTSPDIRALYWLKRKFAWPLNVGLVLVERQVQALEERQRREHHS
ncbi:MAG: SDR family oxidoreductase [Nevskiaceae bacterium]|nr:MAG: SDR family oxidoreductase [Nevskiaceae bacterium]TBR74625.1 MAG: SDR family oxidoreductase [Nevskiaceae bacterium]